MFLGFSVSMSWMILQITQIIQPQASNLEFSNMYVSGIEKSRVEDLGCKIGLQGLQDFFNPRVFIPKIQLQAFQQRWWRD